MQSAVIDCTNTIDSKMYRASIIEGPKLVRTRRAGIVPNTSEIVSTPIVIEAAVGRGRSIFSIMFAPVLVICYMPNDPENRLSFEQFCWTVRAILERCSIDVLRCEQEDKPLSDVLLQDNLMNWFGRAAARFSYRRVTYLFLQHAVKTDLTQLFESIRSGTAHRTT
jgi:hypothetical protein